MSSLAIINKVHWCVAIVIIVSCPAVKTVDDTRPVIDPKPDIGWESQFLPFSLAHCVFFSIVDYGWNGIKLASRLWAVFLINLLWDSFLKLYVVLVRFSALAICSALASQVVHSHTVLTAIFNLNLQLSYHVFRTYSSSSWTPWFSWIYPILFRLSSSLYSAWPSPQHPYIPCVQTIFYPS